MKRTLISTALALLFLVAPVAAQETPASLVAAYEALADVILGVRDAEETLVRALLDGHFHAAETLMKRGDHKGAAAQMALFANEGDNAIGGVRKRLLEGGHHFNAQGEEQGIFEPGYVVVTRETKQKMLAASTAMQRAGSDEERTQVWDSFAVVAKSLLGRS
jgi:hypothetical protein